MTDTPTPWNDSPDPEWQRVVDSWGWNPVVSDDPTVLSFRIEGVCPYCSHHISQNELIGIGFGFQHLIPPAPGRAINSKDTLREAVGGSLPELVTVQCNCDVTHEPDKKGCGKQAQIRFANNINE